MPVKLALGGCETTGILLLAIGIARRLIVWPALMAAPIIFVLRLPSPEQGLAGVLLLLMAVPWAVVGAMRSSFFSTTDGGDDATSVGSVRPMRWLESNGYI